MAKTVVGLFYDTEHARMAVQDLVDMGIPRSDISLMSRTEGEAKGIVTDTGRAATTRETTETAAGEGAAAGAGVGAALGGVGGLLVGLGALAIPGVGPILAAGPLVAALTGAAVGAGVGAVVGALVGMGIPQEEAEYYAEGVRRGGTLVAVNTPENMVNDVTAVLRRHNPVDIKRQAQMWRESGWKGYDPKAQPMSWDEVQRERSTYREYEMPSGERTMGTGGMHTGERTGTRRETMTSTSTRTREQQAVRPWTDYETDFRRDFERRWRGTSATWETYAPVYHYGYDVASDPRYRDRDWDEIEPDVRRNWEREHRDTAWDDIKDAVREAWNRIRGY